VLRGIKAAAGAALVVLVAAPNAFGLGPTTTLDSRDSSSAVVTAQSGSISANGRYVTWASAANGIVPGDNNNTADLFLRDRVTGQTQAINVREADGLPSGADPQWGHAQISDDGRYVAFAAYGRGISDSGLPLRQLFVLDRVTGALQPIVPQAPSDVYEISIDADGRRVAFSMGSQVWMYDVSTGVITRVSQTADGTPGNDGSSQPSISADGHWVAFTTFATNLVNRNRPNTTIDVVAKNVDTGEITLVSAAPGGTANESSSGPAISGNGCVVAFLSYATNLVANDSGVTPKIFARDRCQGTTERVSITNAVDNNQRYGIAADISDDGCLVSFISDTVYSAPPSGAAAVLRDRCAGTTTRLDLSTTGDAGGSVSSTSPVRLSGGSGRYAVFTSSSTSLVTGANSQLHVFVRDRADRNEAPVAVLTVTQEGQHVTADATASHDPDAPTVTGSIAFGDGSPAVDGLRATHDFARPGTYTVTATIKDADGAIATQTQSVTIPDASPPTGPPPPAPLITPPPSTGAVLGSVRLSRQRFAVAPKHGEAKKGQGATLTIALDAAATVTLSFDRATRGHRSHGRCSARAKRGTRCTIYVKAGTITRSLKAGTNRVALTGRLGGRALKPGRYRLMVSAGTAHRSVTFTIVSGG